MIEVDQAWQCVLENTYPLATEQRPLCDALHLVLAADVCADRDIPACDRAAMDGYAVRASDLDAVPAVLRVVGEVPAGSESQLHFDAGECVAIFTGASIPEDADTVVMIEDTESEEEDVRFLQPVKKGQHIFRRAENAGRGDVLVPAGTRLNSVHLGLCATVGCDYPLVHKTPQVSVVTTGEELKDASEDVGDHEIRDSNGPMLAGLLAQHHFPCVSRMSAVDDLAILGEALTTALGKSDVVLVTGGVSVGKYDLVAEAIQTKGGTLVYHGVQMKPGRPQLFAVFPSGQCVFGLPGNPLSVMTGMQEFVLPALRYLSGVPSEMCRPLLSLPVTDDVHTKGGRQNYVLGRMVLRESGSYVEPVVTVGSADLAAAARADGAIVVSPEKPDIARGEMVAFRPWGAV